MIILFPAKTKNPVANVPQQGLYWRFSNIIFEVGCNSLKSTHLIYPFLTLIWFLEVTFVSN